MKTQISLLALSVLVASGAQAMQALDDSSMSDVAGQAGITIEQTTNGVDGFLMGTGEIKYTQADTAGQGEVDVTIDGMTVRSYVFDNTKTNNFGGYNTIRRVIDINADGDLSIKTMDIDTLDIKIGAIAIGGRRVNSGIDINVWKLAAGSYLETEVKNDFAGAKIISRNVMKAGSGYNQIVYENGLNISSDTVFLPNVGDDAFVSELILTSEGDGLKIEVGATKGTMEIKNLSILDSDGTNLFGSGNSFGDFGYGNVTVNEGYITVAASQDPTNRNGIEGAIFSDIDIGNAYYRTGNARLNANNVMFTTGGELHYRLAFMDNGYASGLEGQFVSSSTATASLSIGSLTLSDADGDNETNSIGSLAISNLSLNSGTAEVSIYTLPGYGNEGLRQVINATDESSFDMVLYDESTAVGAPKLSANIVINNLTQDQTINYTKKGIRIQTVSSSMDMNINAIKAGNNQTYQGQSGRIVMNNFHQVSGGYTNIEPLR